ncbi:MAG: hypothetical protein HYU36_16025 [Planctomycetes bacterium]|nr:hypothetical protein [Planctomycetota bacterium]
MVLSIAGALVFELRRQERESRHRADLAEKEKQIATLNAAKLELDRRRLEDEKEAQWILALETDFSEGSLDPRLEPVVCPNELVKDRSYVPAGEEVEMAGGALVIRGVWGSGRAFVRYKEPLSHDLRIEAQWEVREQDTRPILGISVAGDGLEGYRYIVVPRIDYHVLETTARSEFMVLQEGTAEIEKTQEYVLVMEKTGEWVRVWINSQLDIEYFDPLPMSGPQNRSFSLFTGAGAGAICRVKRLKIFYRRSPRVVSVLEIGRTMLRSGNFSSADEFFASTVSLFGDSDVGRQAEFLRGVALQALGKDSEALAIFERLGEAQEASLAVTALAQAARMFCVREEFAKAVHLAVRARARNPGTPAVTYVYNAMITCLSTKTEAGGAFLQSSLSADEQTSYLKMLKELGIGKLDLVRARLKTLVGLEGAGCSVLSFTGGIIEDLGPLRGMKLSSLDCHGNRIRNLTPLSGMPLAALDCSGNPIRDLTPLSGIPLAALDCGGNQIQDLTPLSGMPLTFLDCGDNQIQDLTPLSGIPLAALDCGDNQIQDLTPLSGIPLAALDCGDNQIQDLAPLSGIPLAALNSECNQIQDLTPLSGMPLTYLNCSKNPIRNVNVLRGMPLRRFACIDSDIEDFSALKDAPIEQFLGDTDQAEKVLPVCRQIESINGWTSQQYRRLQDTASQLRSGDRRGRDLAVRVGSRSVALIPLGMSWSDAAAWCRQQGGRLAVPLDLQDNGAIWKATGCQGYAWLGIRFSEAESQWIDPEGLLLSPALEELKPRTPTGPGEFAVAYVLAFHMDDPIVSLSIWECLQVRTKLYFICEWQD